MALAPARFTGKAVLGDAGEGPKWDPCTHAHLLVSVAWPEMARCDGVMELSGGVATTTSQSSNEQRPQQKNARMSIYRLLGV